MKRTFFFIVYSIILCMGASAISPKGTTTIPRYDIMGFGVGAEGTSLTEVFIYTSKADKNIDILLRRAAVHGVIFKGVAATKGYQAQPALAQASSESLNDEFFSSFFADDTRIQSYANILPATIRAEKVGKKSFRIRGVVSINKKALRKYLENAGIIRTLGSGF